MKLAKILKDANRGVPAVDADRLLGEIVAAVKEHGKSGVLTIKVEVKPIGGKEVNVFADVSAKLPKAKLRPALFFMTDDNDLTRNDPDQEDLPFGHGSEQAAAPADTSKITPMPHQANGTTGN